MSSMKLRRPSNAWLVLTCVRPRPVNPSSAKVEMPIALQLSRPHLDVCGPCRPNPCCQHDHRQSASAPCDPQLSSGDRCLGIGVTAQELGVRQRQGVEPNGARCEPPYRARQARRPRTTLREKQPAQQSGPGGSSFPPALNCRIAIKIAWFVAFNMSNRVTGGGPAPAPYLRTREEADPLVRLSSIPSKMWIVPLCGLTGSR